MEPAARIISLLGGPSRLSEAIGVNRVTVSRWKQPKSQGGTGGVIPHWQVPKIIEEARRQGVELSTADFSLVLDAAE